MHGKNIKKIVENHYSQVAQESACCCCGADGSIKSNKEIANSIGYSNDEIKDLSSANLGLGCGNPTALSDIKEGEVVLDLGSGAGLDCFLAANKAGEKGKVIGVDFSFDMIKKAKDNAIKLKVNNVEFKHGDIEKLPVSDGSIDVIISNCVINLAPNKSKVFSEAFRVLKENGRMFVSDIVLLQELSEKVKNDERLLAGCVAGAVLKENYLNIAKKAGFKIEILEEDKDISKRQYEGIALESIKLKLSK